MGKKLLRDCKDNKAELGSIAILVFLALFVFSGLLSASKGMAYEFDKWSSETNLADAWVTPRSQKKNRWSRCFLSMQASQMQMDNLS